MPDLARAARLQQARKAAGYARPVDALTAFGWNRSTYFGHENGTRGISRDRLAVYASALHVRVDWLAYGQGTMRIGVRKIRIEGTMGDLGIIEPRRDELEPDEIELPEGINPDDFFAIRMGDTYPTWQAGDVILVARQHGPPEDHLGQLSLVTLQDGKRIAGRLYRGTRVGLFLLLSSFAPPLMDIEPVEVAPIVWTKHGG